ncbi:phospholipase A [Escherichia coli]
MRLYTQKSWWQLSNAKSLHRFKGKPNRNCSSVLPPITVLQVGRCARWRWGVSRPTNGRSDPTSRSWNRLYLA